MAFHSSFRSSPAAAVAVAALFLLLVPGGAASEPYVASWTYHGHIGYAYGWHVEVPEEGCVVGPDVGVQTAKTCGGGRSGDSLHGEVATPVTAGVATIITELEWDPSVPGAALQLDTFCDEVPRGSGGAVLDLEHPCYSQVVGEGHLRIRIDADDWAGGEYDPIGDWATRVFAGAEAIGSTQDGLGVGYAFDQPFTLYISVFYGEPAPDGYTAIP